jgi:4-amino-4-deoxy-L-arabinose transferase-like glycosyltransferase
VKLTWGQATIITLIISFAVTLSYSFYFALEPSVDARAYDNIALNLVSGAGYRENIDLAQKNDFSIGRVGPGYELFLASIYFVFGHHYWVVWLIQAFLHIASAILLFFLSKELFKERGELIGFVASSSFAFFVDIFELNAMLLTESLVLFLLILSVWLFIKFYRSPFKLNAALLGLVTTAAAMTRPTLLIFNLIFIFFCLIKRYYFQATIIFVCAITLIGPWVWRNYSIYNRVIITTAAGGYDLWIGNNPLANGELEPSQEIKDFSKSHTIIETSERGVKQVVRFVFSEPVHEVELLLIKTSVYFSFARPAAFWFHLRGFSKIATIIFSSGFAFLLFSFGLSGIYFLWKKKEPIYFWLVLLALSMPLTVIPIVVETRYRYPLYPFLSLAFGYFVSLLFDGGLKLKHKEIKVYLLIALLLSANTIFDVLRNLEVVRSKLGW